LHNKTAVWKKGNPGPLGLRGLYCAANETGKIPADLEKKTEMQAREKTISGKEVRSHDQKQMTIFR